MGTFPIVKQRNGHDCGPAVARAVLRHFGRPVVRVNLTLRPDAVNGTPPDRLIDLLLAAGLTVSVAEGMTEADLAGHTAAGRVVLCPVQHKGDGHWVAVYQVDLDCLWKMDPAEGDIPEAWPSFRDRWHDHLANGAALVRFGLIVGAGGPHPDEQGG